MDTSKDKIKKVYYLFEEKKRDQTIAHQGNKDEFCALENYA